jgi:hypothetical protein
MKSFKEILMEMPQLISVKRPILWEIEAKTAMNKHLSDGELVSDDGEHRTTVIKNSSPVEQFVKFARQYQVNTKDAQPKLHIEFKNHSIGKRNGTYSSKLVKLNPSDHVWNHVKSIYDRELDSHDYLISDANQYEGGKHVWKKLSKTYEDSGKHLYIQDHEKLTKVTHADILNGEHSIWGDADKFQHVRLVVSHDPLH